MNFPIPEYLLQQKITIIYKISLNNLQSKKAFIKEAFLLIINNEKFEFDIYIYTRIKRINWRGQFF